jgi:hypothetical protein
MYTFSIFLICNVQIGFSLASCPPKNSAYNNSLMPIKQLREKLNNKIRAPSHYVQILKVHKIEIFFGFDFEICIISLIVM